MAAMLRTSCVAVVVVAAVDVVVVVVDVAAVDVVVVVIQHQPQKGS